MTPSRRNRRAVEAVAVGLCTASVVGLAGYAYIDHRDPQPAGWVTPPPVAAQPPPVPEGLPKTAAPPPSIAAPQPVTPTASAPLMEVPVPVAKKAPQQQVQEKAKKACFKGVATWAVANSAKSMKKSRACWFYSWGADRAGVKAPKGVEFVPMIHRAATIGDVAKAKKAKSRYLLGFNEPDLGDQANMSVEQALELWPRLVATGKTLGSPSVATGGATPGGWLDRFMKGAKSRNMPVHFITLHWYGADFRAKPAALQLRQYLRAVHKRYKKPIWLTEFALTDFTQGAPRYPTLKQQAAFLREATKMLAKEKYIKRYAWFAMPTTQSQTGLFYPNSTPTPAGTTFSTRPTYK
ncbi:glycoside hydrolase family protein [Actinocorallia sp. API 0066]|uniref:glycoside hydrolase family protein n=1 Tax=Actinocorallia sp. API 0066 TaxID=2896846 RepID=UPI001E653E43|nr:glycoside hydrolase family protein [Actinocorallia sp. API 0066]MCD0448114.1 glycoside hydrolase family protein [Actinocorallia sp. API 0066]